MRKTRSAKVKGKFEDAGKYIRCRNCGFHIDTTRLSSGSGDGRGTTVLNPEKESPVSSGDQLLTMVTINSYDTVGGTQGTVDNYYEPRKAIVGSGCPFCGCKNLP